MEVRADLEKRALRYARKLNEPLTKTALSKMKKPELAQYLEKLLTRVMIQDNIEEAEYLDRRIELESERMYEALVSALIRENKLTSAELFYWDVKKLEIVEHPASEYISIRSRASVWSKYADASIILNGTTYAVKNVNVWCNVRGI